MTIVDGWTCSTMFGVIYDPSSNNNSDGGISISMIDQSTSLNEVKDKSNKNIIAVYNMLGKKVEPKTKINGILIFIYDDGSSTKKWVSNFP